MCDVMTEGLARQLRMCGVDAAAMTDLLTGGPRHMVHRALVEAAETEQRVVLTCDRLFITAGYTDQVWSLLRLSVNVVTAVHKGKPAWRLLHSWPACVDHRAFWQPLADVMQAYFVRGNDKRAQLNEVLDAFNIQVFFWLVASGQCVHCFGLAH